jgi:hypothetical protein
MSKLVLKNGMAVKTAHHRCRPYLRRIKHIIYYGDGLPCLTAVEALIGFADS